MGQIVTVSDGAGRSVTVSNWGVAQTSRHLSYLTHTVSTLTWLLLLFILHTVPLLNYSCFSFLNILTKDSFVVQSTLQIFSLQRLNFCVFLLAIFCIWHTVSLLSYLYCTPKMYLFSVHHVQFIKGTWTRD
jgi:hypothetical protein